VITTVILGATGGLMLYKIPLLLSPQPEGGFTVTSPLLPELVTEGDTLDDALSNARDALAAVVEAYEDLGRPLPANTMLTDVSSPLWLETVVTTP
jgi:antitoxin HicB